MDYQNCVKQGRVGLITCDKNTGKCPAFFQEGASENADKAAGGVCLVLGLLIIVICLVGLVTILKKMLMGTSTRVIHKATNINGYLAMLIGAAITVLVQSSSITTSVLTPLVGLDVIQLEQMYPLTLGANIGTTITAIMAAMVSDKVEALQAALAHLLFNVSGILLFYPVPFLRRIPLNAAKALGKATRVSRLFPTIYIALVFFIFPLVFLGISYLFTTGLKAYTVLGTIVVLLICLGLLFFAYWWKVKHGKEVVVLALQNRQRRQEAMNGLAKDLEYLKHEVARLRNHMGLEGQEETKLEEGESDPFL